MEQVQTTFKGDEQKLYNQSNQIIKLSKIKYLRGTFLSRNSSLQRLRCCPFHPPSYTKTETGLLRWFLPYGIWSYFLICAQFREIL